MLLVLEIILGYLLIGYILFFPLYYINKYSDVQKNDYVIAMFLWPLMVFYTVFMIATNNIFKKIHNFLLDFVERYK